LYADGKRFATERKIVDVIRVRAPSSAHAERLLGSLDRDFAATRFAVTLNGDSPATEVELRLDSQTATKLVELFDALGVWLSSGGLDAVQIGFGERTYTLLAATKGKPNDPTAFLLERTIQLQTALDSRIVIEQAKGILAERESITPTEAFTKIRRQARSERRKLHDLAAEIVATTEHQSQSTSTSTTSNSQ
jgi:ANTAR domain